MAVAATTCWARTSSGLVGTRIFSIVPLRMRCTETAVWARSPRCFGNSTPRLTSPTWWPARPTRWRALATLGGDSIWMTRSTAPMSMPSSRLLVATTAGSRPRLRSSSMMARCSFDTEPWWALAMIASAPALAPDWAIILPAGCSDPDSSSEIRQLGALGGDLVEPGGEPLGEATRVGEDDRGAVLLDQVDDVLLDVRPDAGGASGIARLLVVLPGHRHVLDRHDDLEVPFLGRGGSDDLDGRGAAEEPRHLLEGSHRGAEPDPLGRLLEQRVEALEGEREVGAALGAGDGVHLVDDHRLDAAQGLARLAGQDQEQRLRGGDQDVGRAGAEPSTIGRAGVAGPETDRDLGEQWSRGGRPCAGSRSGARGGCARRRRPAP